MKSILMKSILASVVVMVAGFASAQTFPHFNPPPCDFSDQFYGDNGVDASAGGELNSEPDGRFGANPGFRQFGPPATQPNQANFVADTNCATNDPTRRNFRILATTGAFKDDSGAPTEFFSIIAFAHSQSFFEQTYSRTVGAAGTGSGTTISVVNGANPRGITMHDLVGNFEAYGAPKQTITLNGQTVLAPTPCGSLHDPNVASNDCFSLKDGKNPDGSTLSDAATPNLRMDWRVSSNRNAIDGSDNNCINNTDQNCKHKVFSDSPFGYFCDDLLGMWIVTYWWYSQFSVGGTDTKGAAITPTANCNHVLACIRNVVGTDGKVYGNSLDGTPVLKTGDQLHFIEGVPGTPASVFPGQGVPGACLQDSDLPPASAPCGHEGNLAQDGSDGGAVWLVCPVIQDPRNGAIASDAFLDAVRTSGGAFLDSSLSKNFACLQQTGQFCP